MFYILLWMFFGCCKHVTWNECCVGLGKTTLYEHIQHINIEQDRDLCEQGRDLCKEDRDMWTKSEISVYKIRISVNNIGSLWTRSEYLWTRSESVNKIQISVNKMMLYMNKTEIIRTKTVVWWSDGIFGCNCKSGWDLLQYIHQIGISWAQDRDYEKIKKIMKTWRDFS